ncbi:hypothetical protein E7V02_23940 [Escherichia coli]|nr:hypothetical protein [Escherichia coli]
MNKTKGCLIANFATVPFRSTLENAENRKNKVSSFPLLVQGFLPAAGNNAAWLRRSTCATAH